MPHLGNQSARDALAAAMASGSLHHAWLIAGPEGVGKGAFARQAALRMLAEAAEPEKLAPGWDVPMATQAAQLFASANHPDYFEVTRVSRSIKRDETPYTLLARMMTPERLEALRRMFSTQPEAKVPSEPDDIKEFSLPHRGVSVHQVRALIGGTVNKPTFTSRRVVVVDTIDYLETSASNALLKVLEEPPQGTIFLLVSHAPGRLIPTIRSRCRLLRFEALGDADVAAVLRAGLPDATASEIDALVRAGAGSPGRALGFAGLDLAALEADMNALAETGDASNEIRVRLSKLIGPKAAQARYEAFLDRAPSFIAERARTLSGEALRTALDAYAAARELASAALGLSLDASGTVFEMSGLIARLAPGR